MITPGLPAALATVVPNPEFAQRNEDLRVAKLILAIRAQMLGFSITWK